MAVIYLNGKEKVACKETIEELEYGSCVLLSFSDRELFEEKKIKENNKILELCIRAIKERNVRFFQVPSCAGTQQAVKKFNENSIEVKGGFFFEGNFLKPLNIWQGRLPKLSLYYRCQGCRFFGKSCKGCFGFLDTNSLNSLVNTTFGYIKKGDRVLDIGCGTGFYIKTIAREFGAKNLYLLDPKETSVFEVKKWFEKSMEKPSILRGVAENLPIRENFFDVVVMINSFSHFKNPELGVLESFRVLKGNGLVTLLEEIHVKADKDAEDSFDSHNGLKRYEIKALFSEKGFKCILQKTARPYYLLIFKKK